ncbi:methionine--tRNA ligase [Candidatus Kaiserbacteria bacterium]|nr:methionine--tRNA ligase [Candidatus Kaiserbacteria bacterium]
MQEKAGGGKFYITTTLPYVNAKPHIGFALEIVQADVIARYKKLMGYEVFFNTGTDEHGQKIYDKALEEGKDPQAYTDEYAEKFRVLKDALGLDGETLHFIRTTDPHHKHAAQVFWQRCAENGDIYKKLYKIKYCVGCELEKTDSELEDGHCPLHPSQELQVREEENYFFRFSKYQQALLDLYASRPDFVVPDFRQNEIKLFVERGLEDFSISRLKEKMPWGVPVPGDDEHVMYVWFDALINYISTLGWPEKEDFGGFWPGVQLAGKDNLRQQTAMWQAMLMSAKLPNSAQIKVGGFITSGGQKMSKSLGNVIDPLELVAEYGTEAVRYYLMRHVHPFEDSDFTMERFKEAYNANLANGIGNQVARVMMLAQTHLDAPVEVEERGIEGAVGEKVERYAFNEAMDIIFEHIQKGDLYMQEHEPYKAIKSDDVAVRAKAQEDIIKMVRHIYHIASALEPFMPETAEKIKATVRANEKPETLFVRK